MSYIKSLDELIESFRSLPGVGYKTAQRYAYSILNSSKEDVSKFASAMVQAKDTIRFCSECGNFTDKVVCDNCLKANKDIICVVAQPKDVVSMEKVKNANWAYHVLHGVINPLEKVGPNDIRIKELIERVRKYNTKEVIMATNPDITGDTTAYYIADLLRPLGVKVTRLAQGVSMGTDLEYADEVTLSKAFESRNTL